ncbi:MAG: hypothetical protein ACXWN8_08120 [Isosphaeraceae bacterium]
MDQSAALVADRIARSLQDKLRDEQPFSYRIRVETDAHCLAPDIGLDIASIEVAKGDAWEPTLDILEVKYLLRFARRFARLPPLVRALKAFWLLIRSAINRGCARRAARATKANQRQGALNRLDRIQAVWLNLVTLATIGSVVYWLVVGAVAVLGVPAAFNVGFDDILGVFGAGRTAEAKSVWMIIVIAVFLVLAAALRKTFIESLDRVAVESFAVMEYQLDDRRFLAAPNAILDAIDFATKRGYGTVDLLSLSLGAVLATDAIFPRRAREQVWSPPLAIENWITLGYSYDLIRWFRPDYFAERQPAIVDFRRWINVVVQDDFLGTMFTEGDGRGIRVSHCSHARAPDVNPKPFEPESRVRAGRRDWFVPLRRAVNHRIYWDDEDARAPTCFAAVVDAEAAGWTTEVRKCWRS